MEAILAIPSPDRGRDYVLPLSMGGIRVRAVIQTGAQLVAEAAREPVDLVILPEVLPDGPAEMWLSKVAAVSGRRPAAVVLIYGVQDSESIRERVRAAFGPGADVVPAGSRSVQEVAAEAVRVADRLITTVAEQDRDAYQRLQQPVAASTVPQPVRTSGPIALVGASGGVGTSALAANLAAYVAMAGQSVLVVDAQFSTSGSILHYFGVEPDDQNHGMQHLRWSYMSAGGAPRESALEEMGRRLEEVRFRKVRHAEIRVLHVPAILEHMISLPVEQVAWAIQTLERSFDLVLVDCGSGLGDARTIKLLAQAHRILLLSGGWGASVNALARSMAALEAGQDQPVGPDRLFLLLKEAGDSVYGAKTVRATVGRPIYGRIPEEPLLRKADARLGVQVPLVVEAPESAYGKSIAQLAFALGLVSGSTEQKKAAGGSLNWLRVRGRRG